MQKLVLIIFFLGTLISGMLLKAENKKLEEEQKPDKWSFISEDVANINGIKIKKQDLISFINLSGNPRVLYSLSGKNLESYTREMLERLINQVILAQISATEGFTPGFELIKKETETMMSKMSKDEKKRFLDYLASNKMTIDDFCKKKSEDKFQSQQFAIDAWFEQKIKPQIKLNKKEVVEFYDKAGDLVSASQILIKYDGNSEEAKISAKKEAEAILKDLKDGRKDFRVISAQKSHCNSNYKGLPGALKPFSRGEMVQEFEDVAFSLPVGEISDVFETPFGFHIIRVDEKSKRELPPFDKVKDQIKEELITIKGQDKIISKLKEAKKHWKIEVTAFK